MRNSGAGRKTASGSEMDEVEQLLQAAQDDVLLKLSLNSHISRGSSHSLDPDLSRRFLALKTRPSPPKPSPPTPTPTPTPLPPNSNIQQTLPPLPHVDDELKTVLGDDLSARFAALRGSLNPSSSSSSSPPVASSLSQTLPGPSIARCLGDRDSSGSNPDNEEDEVEKVIQWAKDAARLDPSPPSDDDGGDDGGGDDDDDTNTENSSDDDQCDLDEKAKGTKNRPRQGRNPKRILTFLSGHRRK